MRNILKVLAVFSLMFVLTACGSGSEKKASGESDKEQAVTQKQDSEDISKELSSIKVRDLDGNEKSLADYKGKKVYVKLWATWCHVCIETMPEVEELVAENPEFEIVTVTAPRISGEKDEEGIRAFYKEKGYKNIPLWFDSEGRLMRLFNVRALPTNVILDSEGNISAYAPGGISKEQIKTLINETK